MDNTETTKYSVIGLMSGTSLDGLDVAYCQFSFANGSWSYQIMCATTYEYSPQWRQRLSTLENATAFEYALCNVQLGHYFGQCVREFMADNSLACSDVDFVASHGHTVFHRPELALTTQIADPNAIAAEISLPVVADFRTLDLALGGQGAPLVPIGDRLLFSQYDSCLNLGGIANISFTQNNRRVAFDISPYNMILNHLAQRIGMPFDKGGEVAKNGTVNHELLNKLNALAYYDEPFPKSLGKEWFVANFLPLFQQSEKNIGTLLATASEHIATQIANVLNANHLHNVLITGGGAFNSFLTDSLRAKTKCRISIPNALTINYKEAMVFAFLGVLRVRGQANCLSSVTGASSDNCGGVITGTAVSN